MGFETVVLEKVAKVLGTDNRASFTCGTLFVECTVPEAVKIESALLKSLKCVVIFSRVGNESAFDFI